MVAIEFRVLERAVFTYGLEFTEEFDRVPNVWELLKWRIPDIPETKDSVLRA